MQEALTAVGWSLDPHSYKTVLTAVELDGWLDWGLHPGHLHHLQLPDEPSRLPAGCSHAVGKLAEAVDAIGWDMRKVKVAVDLGKPRPHIIPPLPLPPPIYGLSHLPLEHTVDGQLPLVNQSMLQCLRLRQWDCLG